eukprot:COSAG02_NODE_20917_length_810_cov_0.582278_2_plen_29_part_01
MTRKMTVVGGFSSAIGRQEGREGADLIMN